MSTPQGRTYTATEIHSLIERFEAQQLPKQEWTHPAHLVVAIWYTRKYGEDRALEFVRDLITRHNASVGTPNTDDEGYHETITRFWLRVAGQFLVARASITLEDACNELIASPEGRSDHPLKFYHAGTLWSVKARHEWVEPDRVPATG